MKVYQPLTEATDGRLYKEWEIPEGFPIPDNFVTIAPTEGLLFPRWDYTQGRWVEDKDSIIADLKSQLTGLQSDLMDLMELYSGGEA